MIDLFSAGGNFTIVSGGQTGADRAALDWAIAAGIAHGGWCPQGRRAEDGLIAACYQLKETPASNYLQRSEWNVRDSDATLIFTLSDKLDGGSKRTAGFADELGKPSLHVCPGIDTGLIARFLHEHGVIKLNVAGKRASTAPGIEAFVQQALSQAVFAPDRP